MNNKIKININKLIKIDIYKYKILEEETEFIFVVVILLYSKMILVGPFKHGISYDSKRIWSIKIKAA